MSERSKASEQQVGGSHYKTLAIQPAEYCQRNGLRYCEANVVKYVTRHREKGGRQDIEKAIHYLQLLLEIEYPQTQALLAGKKLVREPNSERNLEPK